MRDFLIGEALSGYTIGKDIHPRVPMGGYEISIFDNSLFALTGVDYIADIQTTANVTQGADGGRASIHLGKVLPDSFSFNFMIKDMKHERSIKALDYLYSAPFAIILVADDGKTYVKMPLLAQDIKISDSDDGVIVSVVATGAMCGAWREAETVNGYLIPKRESVNIFAFDRAFIPYRCCESEFSVKATVPTGMRPDHFDIVIEYYDDDFRSRELEFRSDFQFEAGDKVSLYVSSTSGVSIVVNRHNSQTGLEDEINIDRICFTKPMGLLPRFRCSAYHIWDNVIMTLEHDKWVVLV